MSWHFLLRTELVVGNGARFSAPEHVARYGRRLALVTGGRSLAANGHEDEIVRACRDAGLDPVVHARIVSEPDVAAVDSLVASLRRASPTVILAIGGGSVIDAAKAATVLVAEQGSVREFLEGLATPPRQPGATPLPLLAMPTTAGTGAEVTANAVIQVGDLGVKRSMRAPALLPRVALVDDELLIGQPRRVAGAAAFDAFAHLLESWLSTAASPMTDLLAEAGLRRAWAGIAALRADRLHHAERADLALAATWGGICLANARLGAAHGLVAALCGCLPAIGHGHGVARLLPGTLSANARALATRDNDCDGRRRMVTVCRIVGADDAQGAAAVIRSACDDLGLEPLSLLGLKQDLLPVIAAKPSGSIRTNPAALSEPELVGILRTAM